VCFKKISNPNLDEYLTFERHTVFELQQKWYLEREKMQSPIHRSENENCQYSALAIMFQLETGQYIITSVFLHLIHKTTQLMMAAMIRVRKQRGEE
jgi:hypothetical protein